MKKWLNRRTAPARVDNWQAMLLVAMSAITSATGLVKGQCGEWDVQGNSSVVAGSSRGLLVAWDRDGDGPEQELLVAGATSQVGDLITTLAGWDGSYWVDLHPGTLQVGPLCVAGNDLLCVRESPREIVRVHSDLSYTSVMNIGMSNQVFDAVSIGDAAYVLGRSFDDATPSWWIRRFDGNGWADIPMSFSATGSAAVPTQLAAWNGTLVVAGNFDHAGGGAADRIALWDGDSWEALAPYPDALLIPRLGTHQGVLFGVGRVFARRWTGSSWEVPAASTFPSTGQYYEQPVAAFGENGVYLPLLRTRFDGLAWVPFDSTVMISPTGCVAWRGTVVCSGYTNYQQYRRYLVVAQDNAFVPLGSGISNEPLALGGLDGGVIAAGVLGAGGRVATPVVRWDGNAWHNIGVRPEGYNGAASVSGVCTWGGAILLGHSGWTSPGALMRLDGDTWASWSPAYWQTVHRLGVVQGRLVVLGQRLHQVGSVLAAWDGEAWIEIAPSADASLIQSAVIGPDRVAIEGTFTSIAGVPAAGVAVWDGQAWSGVPRLDEGTRLIGAFRGAPVVNHMSFAYWWNGYTWVEVPAWNGTADPQTAVEYQGDLILAGWTTCRWSPERGVRPLGNDEGTSAGQVHATALVGGSIYLAGTLFRVENRGAGWITSWTDTPTCDCDSIDFNRDNLFPDIADIPDFLSVFSGGLCARQPATDEYPCNSDIDFNNDGLFPDTIDIEALLSVFSGGVCVQ